MAALAPSTLPPRCWRMLPEDTDRLQTFTHHDRPFVRSISSRVFLAWGQLQLLQTPSELLEGLGPFLGAVLCIH